MKNDDKELERLCRSERRWRSIFFTMLSVAGGFLYGLTVMALLKYLNG